jgi:hypothetical protein
VANRQAHRTLRRSALPLVAALIALAVGAFVVHAASEAQTAKKKRKAPAAFIVTGTLAAPIAPGGAQQVKVKLSNKQSFPIYVTKLKFGVSIDPAHAAAGCSVPRDFAIAQLTKKTFPIKLRAKKKVKKRKGKSARKRKIAWVAIKPKKAKGLPSLAMHNLPGVNQDACKGATLNLLFSGKAQKIKPGKKKRKK